MGQRFARVRLYNANELLTKALLGHTERHRIRLDLTIEHTLAENSVAERTNRTLIDRVRETITKASMSFKKYWTLCLLDKPSKENRACNGQSVTYLGKYEKPTDSGTALC